MNENCVLAVSATNTDGASKKIDVDRSETVRHVLRLSKFWKMALPPHLREPENIHTLPYNWEWVEPPHKTDPHDKTGIGFDEYILGVDEDAMLVDERDLMFNE